MTTLRIEHPISDFAAWQTAFSRFAPARAHAGVRAYEVRQPIDDPHYVLIDLEFDDTDAATAFGDYLRTTVWAKAEHSPALIGTPITRILETRSSSHPVTPPRERAE